MTQRILLIDDDQELCSLLADFLKLEGFATDSVHDGVEAVQRCREQNYEAIVLDVMLPRLQGFDVLRKLREFSRTPIIMLTARGDETDRIVGLEMGADDYLPKPCNPRELAARLRAILRRSERPQEPDTPELQIGQLRLNSATRSMQIGKRQLKLTTAEFNILAQLMRHAGEVVSRDALSQQALGRTLTAYDRSVDVHVSNLRKKLGKQGDAIVNIRSVGYQLTLQAQPGPA
jgi:DNA-binding response OmpR family regulator